MNIEQIDTRIKQIRGKINNIPNMGFGKQEAADRYAQALSDKIGKLESKKHSILNPEPTKADLQAQIDELKQQLSQVLNKEE